MPRQTIAELQRDIQSQQVDWQIERERLIERVNLAEAKQRASAASAEKVEKENARLRDHVHGLELTEAKFRGYVACLDESRDPPKAQDMEGLHDPRRPSPFDEVSLYSGATIPARWYHRT